MRVEYSHLYPALKAGEWEPAALMAEKLIAWLLGKKKHGYVNTDRVLPPEHFEFRGGEVAARTEPEPYSRREDSEPPGPASSKS